MTLQMSDQTPIVTIFLAALAALPALAAIALSLRAAMVLVLNTQVFLRAIEKCLRADNRERAIKLARTSDAPVAKLALAALTLDVPRFSQAGATSYRGAADPDMPARVSAALSLVAMHQRRRLLPSMVSGVAALLLPITPLLLVSLSADAENALRALVGLGGVSGLVSLHRYSRVRRDLSEVSTRLGPWVLPGGEAPPSS